MQRKPKKEEKKKGQQRCQKTFKGSDRCCDDIRQVDH
jgi:hypothetical protein